MGKLKVTVIFGILSLLAFSCGKSKEMSQMQQMAETAKQMGEAAQNQAQQKPVNPVDAKTLAEFLPKSIDGMTTEGPSTDMTTIGEWKYSSAKCTWRGTNDQSLEIQVVDYAGIQMMYAPFEIWAKGGYSHEDARGFERSATVDGYPGFEKVSKQGSKDASAQILVGHRYWVSVELHGSDDLSKVESILKGMNLPALEKAS